PRADLRRGVRARVQRAGGRLHPVLRQRPDGRQRAGHPALRLLVGARSPHAGNGRRGREDAPAGRFRPPLPAAGERRRAPRDGGRLSRLQLLAGGQLRAGRADRRGGGAVRAAGRAAQPPRPPLRGVRPPAAPPDRQLPAGLLAPGAHLHRPHPRLRPGKRRHARRAPRRGRAGGALRRRLEDRSAAQRLDSLPRADPWRRSRLARAGITLGEKGTIMMPSLQATVNAIVTGGKGLLAADERVSTITKRFTARGIASTPELRRDYREMLFSTPEISAFIGGVILHDETIRQQSAAGTPLVTLLKDRGLVPGIKVDEGTRPLAGAPG